MTNAKAKANSGAAQPAALLDADNSADNGKGVPSLHLAELNARSAKLGFWDVFIFQQRIDEWTCTDKSTDQKKHNAVFRCLLVSSLNPSEYAVAQQNMRVGNENRRPTAAPWGEPC